MAGRSVAHFFPAQPPNPNAPGGFRFAQPGALDAVLREAGLTEFSIESRPVTLDCSSTADYWQMFVDVAAGIKPKISALDERDAAQLRRLVETAAQPYIDNGRLRMVATSLCASGRR